ncbi:MAG: DUF1064 domain-containing protein [Octadecabacter sp.]|nr:DUF1064 domain-containing protein [Octadecabacter sp.]
MTSRITASSCRKAKGTQRVAGAKRTVVDGIKFQSRREARRWLELRQLEKAGRIARLERQVKIPLAGRDGPILTPTGRQMHYVADFRYVDWDRAGQIMIEDAKGWATEVYKIKRAILAAQGVTITEV